MARVRHQWRPRAAGGLRVGAAALLIALAAPPCAAHDFWIEPTSFRPAAGAPVGLGLRVGEGFAGEPLPRDERLLRRFVAAGPAGVVPVPGLDGSRPAGRFAPAEPGLYVVGYASGDTVVRLGAEAFARYIEEEGLEPQLAAAAPPPALVRDAFSRCAKALLLVPGGGTAGFDRRLGLPLELVPLADPHRLAGGDGSAGGAAGAPVELPVELLYDGRPLPGVRVTALHRDDPSRPVVARTDADGRVRLRLPRGGAWLVKAVRIEPAPEGSGADYRSVWASLTFELPGS